MGRARKEVVRYLTVIVVMVVFAVMTASIAGAAKVKFLSLGTGNPSGTFYFLGAGFADLWNKNIPGIKVVAESTAASNENLFLVARGKLDLAISVSSAMAQQVEDKKWDLSQARILCSSTHGSHYHYVVRKESDIKTHLDFKGRKMAIGAPGSGTLVSSQAMIRGWGWDPEKDIDPKYLNFTEMINALRDKTIDVAVVAAAAPVAALLDLAITVPIRLIPITTETFVKPNTITDLYTNMVIPGGTYKGIDEDVKTQASPTFLIVNKAVDNDLAYKLLEVLYGLEKERNRIHPAARGYNLGDAFAGVIGKTDKFVPFHDGAIQYYKDKGVWNKMH